MKTRIDFSQAADSYLTYLRSVRMVSPATLKAYAADLELFRQFLLQEGLAWEDLTPRNARGFASVLAGGGYAAASVNRTLSGVRRFYRSQWRNRSIDSNPFEGLEGLKQGRKLPKVLPREDLEKLLQGLTGEDFAGRRDRLLVEFLYSTGCRISEAVEVDLDHFDPDWRRLKVRGKGSKERVVFLGGPARKVLRAYLPLREARADRDRLKGAGGALFLNQKGGRLTSRGAALILEKHARRLGLAGSLNPHAFRHTFATDLLDGGADIREVQEMLGHASLSTTQIYTHLGIERLKQVHRTAHPHGKDKGVRK